MSHESLQLRRPTGLAILTLLGLVFIFVLTVVAQSGRRGRGSSSPPPPTPEASPSPTATKSPEKAGRSIVLGIDAHDMFSNIPRYFNDTVLDSCAERLNSKLSVKVTTSRDMNRAEAVKSAKAEKEAYVALIQLRVDTMGSSGRNADLSRVYIEYFVLAPTSAKQVGSGNVYQQSLGYKGVIVGRPNSGDVVTVEYRLKQAARDAADRILSDLPDHTPRGTND